MTIVGVNDSLKVTSPRILGEEHQVGPCEQLCALGLNVLDTKYEIKYFLNINEMK
jgi:hypothetical protein